MAKIFNINGACRPDKHYMVDLRSRLEKIKKMVDSEEYFVINRARQYGKTTILRALAEYLRDDYLVISLDFQKMSYSDFENEAAFVHGMAREVSKQVRHLQDIPVTIQEGLAKLADRTDIGARMAELFDCFSEWCGQSDRPVVLIVDEVDTATNNQVFLDFLAQTRAAYLDRDVTPAFHSVILAGVHDVRNIRQKIRPDAEHRMNSPWNIAAAFRVDMSFSAEEIAGMLAAYEADHHTGMDIQAMAGLLYDYTSGYPYLVSALCKIIDEEVTGAEGFPDKNSPWTEKGFMTALKRLLMDNNALFQSLTGRLIERSELRTILHQLLFTGRPIPYVPQDPSIDAAVMFGFIKNVNGSVTISNRIFESILYDLFITESSPTSQMYSAGLHEKNQFITSGHLNVRRILEKFVETFDYLYGDQDVAFLEDEGRRYFLLFLRPIINGVGNCSVEPQTRNNERMDLVIYYQGEQHIIEMKIWRGNAYNERGEKQLSDYLDYFHLKKGYMLSFNFNKNKEIGIKEVVLGDRLLIEAVV